VSEFDFEISKLKMKDGKVYKGQMKDGKKWGRGKLMWPDGSIKEG
jgi:hypothetical protein